MGFYRRETDTRKSKPTFKESTNSIRKSIESILKMSPTNKYTEIETQTSQKSADEYLESSGLELARQVNTLEEKLQDVGLVIRIRG